MEEKNDEGLTDSEGRETSGIVLSNRSSDGNGGDASSRRSTSNGARRSLLINRSTRSVLESRTQATWIFKEWNESDQTVETLLNLLEGIPDLKKLQDKYHWFVVMLVKVLTNKITCVTTVKTDAANISKEEAINVGSALAFSLLCNVSPTAAVDEWFCQYPALEEVEDFYPDFMHFFTRVGSLLVKRAAWGLNLRVGFGAVVGLAEMLTDVVVAIEFFQNDRANFGQMIAGMVGISVFLQIIFTCVQNHKLGFKRQFLECAVIIVGLRPALDAYRVSSSKQREKDQLFEPFMELCVTRVIEMFAEGIPGCVIQIAAVVTGDGSVSVAVGTSILFSVLSVGTISAMVSYDFDVDPKARYRVAEFYGYVPDNSTHRAIIFFAMMAFSAAMLVLKSVTFVLLWKVDTSYPTIYVVADCTLYLLYKIARDDFWHWFPITGALAVFGSVVMRILTKLVTDFTGMLDFRIPIEVGGAYWLFSTMLTFCALPGVIVLYEEEFGTSMVHGISLWGTATSLIAVACASIGVFLFYIEERYRRTFYTFDTGKQFCIRLFQEAEDDFVKADAVFSNCYYIWRGIEPEIKAWVGANWFTWVKEKPIWFDDALKASIPLDMIPMNDRSNMRKLRETVSFNEKITRRKIIGMGELKMDTRRIRKTIDRKEGKVERKGKTNKVAPVSDPPV